MKAKLLLLSFLFGASAAFGQVSFGVKAGVPVTDFFETGSTPTLQYFTSTRRYTLGPTFEVHLLGGLGVEVDALYKRLDYESSTFSVDTFTNSSTRGNSWEFPLLLKYRAGGKLARPFLDAGVSFHHVSALTNFVTTIAPSRVTSGQTSPGELLNDFNAGFVIGGGLDIHALVLHVSPELRYTRWSNDTFGNPSGTLRSNRNQVEFLVGFTF